MRVASVIASAAMLAASVSTSWAGAVIVTAPVGVAAVSKAGLTDVAPGVDIPTGTRLIVNRAPKGAATADTVLKFADGCTISLNPGQVFTINEASPCTFKADVGDGAGLSAPVIIGGVVVAGAIAGVVVAATSGKGGNNNVLPIIPISK